MAGSRRDFIQEEVGGRAARAYACSVSEMMVETKQPLGDSYHVDPHFLAHLAPDVTEPLDAVYTLCLKAPVPQHPQHLSILCTPRTRTPSEPAPYGLPMVTEPRFQASVCVGAASPRAYRDKLYMYPCDHSMLS